MGANAAASSGVTSQQHHAKPMQPPTSSMGNRQPPQSKPMPGSDKANSGGAPSTDSKPLPPREPRDQRPPRRGPAGGDSERDRESSRSGAGEPDDFRRGRPAGAAGGGGSEFSRLPDSQQLFVGNLPHTVSDKELREQFEGQFVV